MSVLYDGSFASYAQPVATIKPLITRSASRCPIGSTSAVTVIETHLTVDAPAPTFDAVTQYRCGPGLALMVMS